MYKYYKPKSITIFGLKFKELENLFEFARCGCKSKV